MKLKISVFDANRYPSLVARSALGKGSILSVARAGAVLRWCINIWWSHLVSCSSLDNPCVHLVYRSGFLDTFYPLVLPTLLHSPPTIPMNRWRQKSKPRPRPTTTDQEKQTNTAALSSLSSSSRIPAHVSSSEGAADPRPEYPSWGSRE